MKISEIFKLYENKDVVLTDGESCKIIGYDIDNNTLIATGSVGWSFSRIYDSDYISENFVGDQNTKCFYVKESQISELYKIKWKPSESEQDIIKYINNVEDLIFEQKRITMKMESELDDLKFNLNIKQC